MGACMSVYAFVTLRDYASSIYDNSRQYECVCVCMCVLRCFVSVMVRVVCVVLGPVSVCVPGTYVLY